MWYNLSTISVPIDPMSHALLWEKFISCLIIQCSLRRPNSDQMQFSQMPINSLFLAAYRTSGAGAAATAISFRITSVVSSRGGLPSKMRRHHIGGSNGRDPLCNGGYTSEKKYQTCPITTPIISSLGIVPCTIKLKPISTHGRYGAVKTSSPKKLSLVSGLRLDQM
jgi:hypothetical protein